MKKLFVLQKNLRSLKVLKLQDITQISIYFHVIHQLSLQVNNIFIQNESLNPDNIRDRKLLFMPHINTTHFGTKSLRYNCSLTWNKEVLTSLLGTTSESMNNNNFINVGILNLKII